jgi:carbonic anhydrase
MKVSYKKTACFMILVIMIMVPVLLMAEDSGAGLSVAIVKKLQDGNARFFNNQRQFPNLGVDRLLLTAKAQHPYATVLACSDSRVPVEHIFDAGIGDIFVIRVAGNVVGTDETASIEYGTEHLKTPLLVVLGHTSCGAVTAAARGDKAEGSIPALIAHIDPAVQKAKQKIGAAFSTELVEESVRMNIFHSMEDIFENSHIVAELVKENRLKVIGALYHIDSGKVDWLGSHPDQKKLVAAAGGSHSSFLTERWIIISIIAVIFIVVIVFVKLRNKNTSSK